jgi:hypothetical protein
MSRGVETSAPQEAVTALVCAIRRAYGKPSDYGWLVAFHVADIHEFARRLVEQGIRVEEPRTGRE